MAFAANPDLAAAVKLLAADKFEKLIAFLRSPVGQRVRTNNHVERTNRMFRFLEKVRYKWRRRRTLVRFVVLTLDRIWKERTTARPVALDQSKATGPGKAEGETRKQRLVA